MKILFFIVYCLCYSFMSHCLSFLCHYLFNVFLIAPVQRFMFNKLYIHFISLFIPRFNINNVIYPKLINMKYSKNMRQFCLNNRIKIMHFSSKHVELNFVGLIWFLTSKKCVLIMLYICTRECVVIFLYNDYLNVYWNIINP